MTPKFLNYGRVCESRCPSLARTDEEHFTVHDVRLCQFREPKMKLRRDYTGPKRSGFNRKWL